MVKQQTVEEQANGKRSPTWTSQEFCKSTLGRACAAFDTHSTEDALATMVEDAYVNNIQ